MNPVKPSFGASEGGPNPAPLGSGNNLSGAMNNPAPVSLSSQSLSNEPQSGSAWSPSAIPAPGPISSGSAMSSVPVPVPAPAPAPQPAPVPAPVMPPTAGLSGMPMPTAPRPNPVIPPIPASNTPVPPPPVVGGDVEVRTMQSDIASVKTSGGSEPTPQMFSPSSLTGEPVFDPKTAATKKKGGAEKIIIFVVIGLIMVGALAAAFFLLKDLFIPVTQTPEAPVENMPFGEVPPPPAAPEGENLPSATVPPIETVHASFFTLAADLIEEQTFKEFTVDALKAVIPAKEALADGSIREIVLKTETGFVDFPSFMAVMIPDIVTESVKENFENDFTFFVYRDKGTDLIGFIAKAKPTISVESFAAMGGIETSNNLHNFYLTDPGTIGVFKEGTVNSQFIRYASFSKAGYAFDYGWLKDTSGNRYFVVSSSYSGIKEAVKRAGF